METAKLKKFAQQARRSLIEQVTGKLKVVLAEDSPARRELPKAIAELQTQIEQTSKEQVIEKVAYIWFNRFCALRFMDVNRYTRIGVVSPAEGQSQPEILAEAKGGYIDEDLAPEKIRQKIFALLNGTALSRDPQGEAYRLLVVAVCNDYYKAMPYLFERIADYTELLMPDDLLSGNSILAYTREAMTPDACEDVEVIGWLYQFYISEKKDEVFDGLKKNRKITPENIPAATQLFTPHWIVRYLVENSLGRLWMLNRPNSSLVERMDYYIKPEQAETDFLKINSPEEIKICDPACGSGHMLTYAFDLLYAIYEEEGYEPAEIPEKILTNNLYGIEIDERAGELAAFALTMKARAKQRRFFNKGVKPNICVLENVHFNDGEIDEYMTFIGRDLFTAPLQSTLTQFEEADNFGSLIRPDVTDVDGMLRNLESKNVSGQLFISMTHQKVLQVLRQAEYLSPKYHVVIANPPYMGSKGMNGRLAPWVKDNYPNSKSDLFAMFIERGLELVPKYGYIAMVTMHSWMFLSSFEKFRHKLLKTTAIEALLHMGNMVMGIAFGTVATVWKKAVAPEKAGGYCYVGYEDIGSDGFPSQFPPSNSRNMAAPSDNIYRVTLADLQLLPGQPVAYWISQNTLSLFSNPSLGKYYFSEGPCKTGNDEIYLRLHWEVDAGDVGAENKWCFCSKGGDYRKYSGNIEYLIRWDDKTREHYKKDKIGRITAEHVWTEEGVTWSIISAKSGFSFRLLPANVQFNSVSPTVFPFDKAHKSARQLLVFLNSSLANSVLSILNPTLALNVGNVLSLPIVDVSEASINQEKPLIISIEDWNSFETSWDFTSLPLLNPDYRQPTLKAAYQKLRAHWREMTLETKQLEQENNRIFIEAYGLQDELTAEVPLNEITLTCNPYYRYGDNKTDEEMEALLLADTMRELVSYAVGCMFGRYALDKPGLILANQGETIEDYLKRVPEPSFPADDDNVIPMLDGDWFTDDIAERFRKFLRVAFGEEQYEENLKFIEQALGKDIRKYFLKDFYSDHVRRYKKRPIYWLLSSPKGSFNALIYLHRYRSDTVSVVLNDYLREFRTKLTAKKDNLEQVGISATASQSDKTKALKEIEKLKKILDELQEYEREVLYPLATQQIAIDLDDGVKVNYLKFGEALKKIPGLEAKEE